MRKPINSHSRRIFLFFIPFILLTILSLQAEQNDPYYEFPQEGSELATRAAPVVFGQNTVKMCFGGTVNSTLVGLASGGTPPYTYIVVGPPTQGTFTLNPTAGTYTYVNNGRNKRTYRDLFYFKVTDSIAQTSNTAGVTISVGFQDTAGSVNACPGVPVNATIFNQTFAATAPRTYFLVTPPTQGTFTPDANFLTNGQYIYTPNNPFQGSLDSFTFQIHDFTGCAGNNNYNTITFRVGVTANSFSAASVCLGTGLAGTVSGNVSGGTPPYTYSIVTSPQSGSLIVTNFTSTGSFTYTPNTSFNGTSDSFTYQATDSAGCLSKVATVTLPIAPIIGSNSTLTAICSGVSETSNLSGLAGGGTAPYIYQIVTSPNQGTLSSFSGTTGAFTYTANSLFFGSSDSFTYRATDATNCLSTIGTITIPVGLQLPNTSFNTCQNTPLNGSISGIGTAPFTFTQVTATSHGTLALASNGVFTYTPTTGFQGPTDTFTYFLTDAHGCVSNIAMATITIGLTPIASTTTTGICIAGTLTSVLSGTGSGGTPPYSYTLVSDVSNGTLTIDPGFASNGQYSYTANPFFNGPSDSFAYQIVDVNGCTSNIAIVTIPVGIEVIDYNTQVICKNANIKSTINGVILGGLPPYIYNLTGSGPTHGILSLNPSTGAYTYTPTVGFSGPSDSFSYTVTDSTSCVSDTATITIPVGLIFPPATIGPVSPGSPISSSLKNFITRGKSPFTFVTVSPVSNGTFTPGPGFTNNGNFTYTPNVTFAGPSDSFTYQVTDKNGCVSSVAQVTVLVS